MRLVEVNGLSTSSEPGAVRWCSLQDEEPRACVRYIEFGISIRSSEI
jgi:hypothetical protein